MLLTFLFKKLLKNFTCSVLIFRFKNYTASVYSLKDFIVYFSMYFLFLFQSERFALYYTFFYLSILFSTFFKKLFYLFKGKIKN